MALVECVPNFSEGRDSSVIDAITAAITSVDGITLLDVDPGAETNRTVVTFVGEPDCVAEAAFSGIATAAELINMENHSGAHPRIGATDVCPFIPVSGITREECVDLSRRVAERVGSELGIPVYLYEHSAATQERKNLAQVREGEYEGLEHKLSQPQWKPDFGPARFNAKAGATVMGCRDFLIAYNINLNTSDARLATDLAFEIREKGRAIRRRINNSVNLLDGDLIRYASDHYPCSYCDNVFKATSDLIAHSKTDHDFDIIAYWQLIGYQESSLAGKTVKRPGLYRGVKAIGWYIPEYRRAQISINFTDYKTSPIHEVFDTVVRLAEERGVRVTGSELVGLVPLEALLMAGRHYLERQQRTTGIPESDMVEVAVQSLGLRDLGSFDPQTKIIDYAVRQVDDLLVEKTVSDFVRECSRNSTAPGGGSVSALAGELGAALVSMVAALTHEKKGYFTVKPCMQGIGDKAQILQDKLHRLVDEDTRAFNAIMASNRLPATTAEEKQEKVEAQRQALKQAVLVPLHVAQLAFTVMELAQQLISEGNPNSVSDVGVAIEVGAAAARGAILNVKINLSGLDDEDFIRKTETETERILEAISVLQQDGFTQTMNVIERT
ncbi:MAG: glutamate formimidoyltransferase [Fidelibacterota bacterium]